MQLSSIEVALRGLQSAIESLDVETISGADASRLLDVVTPHKNRLDAFVVSLSARAVAANQHNLEGASSGASWIAAKTGQSTKKTRGDLATRKAMASLPELEASVRSGDVSLEKAAVVSRAVDGDEAVARSLLKTARDGSFEELQRKAQALTIRSVSRERLRRSQYVVIKRSGDSLVTGEFRLLPELAVSFLEADRKAKGASSWERAESFVQLLSESGTKRTDVVFHLELSSDLEVGERCELKGVGPVPLDTVIDQFKDASFKFVGTVDNKLEWFSETDRRSTTKELPEYVKRAARAKAWDVCEAAGCVRVAIEVDHIQARCNQGVNDFSNLQGLCGEHHTAKTKQDAPWTAGGIYGKWKAKRVKPEPLAPVEARPPPEAGVNELFPDTGWGVEGIRIVRRHAPSKSSDR